MKALKLLLTSLILFSSIVSNLTRADELQDKALAYDSFKSPELNKTLFSNPKLSPYPLDKKVAKVQFGEYLKAMNTLLLNIAATKRKNSEIWDDYVSSARVIYKRYEELKLNPKMTKKQRIDFKASVVAGAMSIKETIKSDKQLTRATVADHKIFIAANKAGYYYNYPKTEIVPAYVYMKNTFNKETNKLKMYSIEQVLILGLINQLIATGAVLEIRDQE